MNKSTFPILLLCLQLTACAAKPAANASTEAKQPLPAPASANTDTQKNNTATPAKPLDGDMFYHMLMANLAEQRGELSLAAQHRIKLAEHNSDASSAQKAWQLANQISDHTNAAAAAEVWFDLTEDPQAAAAKLFTSLKAKTYDPDERLFDYLKELPDPGYPELAAISAQVNDYHSELEALVLAAPATNEVHQGSQLIALAIFAGLRNDLTTAQSLLTQGLGLHPQVDGYILLADLTPEKREQILEDGRTHLPHSHKLAEELWKSYLSNQEYELARELARNMSRLSTSEQWHEHYAAISYQLGDIQSAIQSYYQLFQRQNKQGLRALQIGNLYSELNENELALKWLQLAHGDDVLARSLHLQHQLHKGDMTDQAFFAQQYRLYPDKYATILRVEADVHLINGDNKAAMQLLADYFEQTEHAEVGYDLSLLLEQQGDAPKAKAILEQILANNPQYADALNGLGYMLIGEEAQWHRAEILIRQALQIEPDNAAYADSLAWLFYQQQKYDAAMTILEKAIRQMEHPEVIGHLVEVYIAKGLDQRAMQLLDYGLSKFPTDAYLMSLQNDSSQP